MPNRRTIILLVFAALAVCGLLAPSLFEDATNRPPSQLALNANVLFVHMRGLELNQGCDKRLAEVMLAAQSRGLKPHYFHFNGSQPVVNIANALICTPMVKDWAMGRKVAGLPKTMRAITREGRTEHVSTVQGVHRQCDDNVRCASHLSAPEYAFMGDEKNTKEWDKVDARFCDGLLTLLDLMTHIQFRAVVAPVWFWNHDSIAGHLYHAIRQVQALPQAVKKVKGRPLLLTMSDDAHTARESLLLGTETCWEVKKAHEERRKEISTLERRAYAESDAAVFISHADLEASRDLLHSTVKGLVSNAVVGKVSEIPRDSPSFHDRHGFLFLGMGLNPTNYQASEWFFNEVWPLILQAIPNANITMLGMKPDWGHQCVVLKCHCKWHQHGWEGPDPNRSSYKGEIADKEIPEYFNKARVFIVPVVSATGVITKNFQAYKHHLPLLVTDVGARGMDRPLDSLGAVVTKAGDAGEFARAAIRLHSFEADWNEVRRNMNRFAIRERNQTKGDAWFDDIYNFIRDAKPREPA